MEVHPYRRRVGKLPKFRKLRNSESSDPTRKLREGGGWSTSHATYVRYLHKASSLVAGTFCQSRLERYTTYPKESRETRLADLHIHARVMAARKPNWWI